MENVKQNTWEQWCQAMKRDIKKLKSRRKPWARVVAPRVRNESRHKSNSISSPRRSEEVFSNVVRLKLNAEHFTRLKFLVKSGVFTSMEDAMRFAIMKLLQDFKFKK